MAPAAVKRWRLGAGAVVVLLLALLAALDMISNAVQDSEQLSRWFVPLLLFTVAGLVVLALLVAYNLFRLMQDYRGQVVGSRLTSRMVVLFTLLSLAPVSVVYYYSLQFLMRGIDSWFDVGIETAMEDALQLGRASLDLHKRELLSATEQLVYELEDSSTVALALSVGDLRIASDATEMALIELAGNVIASSNVDPSVLVPDLPETAIIQQVQSGKNYVGMAPVGAAGQLHVRCLVRDPLARGFMLQALYPVPDTISDLSVSVQGAYVSFRERVYLRDSIKFSFSLALSLVLLVSLFAAVWAAFITSRRIVAPITNLASGTRAVAAGDYDKQLPMPATQDELSVLVGSFNAMTRRVAQARDAADRSKRELGAQHAYLETVLGGLSTGVMAIDSVGKIQTSNPAAEQILRVSLSDHVGRDLHELATTAPQLAPFVEAVEQGLEAPRQASTQEVNLFRSEGRQVLLCRRSPLAAVDSGAASDQVLVFDDVTALIKAQRDAAWGEVARRLAHEIKNPLTPIQLSADRLRRKLLKTLSAEDAQVLDRATHTIVQQVEAMKAMVNDFSDYAKPSKIELEALDLDAYVAGITELYRGGKPPVRYERGAPGTRIEADPVRLRQVLHNLVKNAQEAVADRADGLVTVSTRAVSSSDARYAEISVDDNGPGFDPDSLGQVFEPYVTTKAKGTGLGLAIVKKIVEEHGGRIEADNQLTGGARVAICLPTCDDSALTSDSNLLRPAALGGDVL